jgi:predicted nucleotidyltransferase
VSAVGFVLLKLIAWRDRPTDMRAKDGLDIGYVLENCAKIVDEEELWDATQLLERYDHDIGLVAAHLLGSATRSIASTASAAHVEITLRDSQEDLSVEIDRGGAVDPSHNARLLGAFSEGFFAK